MKYCVQCGSIIDGVSELCERCAGLRPADEVGLPAGVESSGEESQLFSAVVDERKAAKKLEARQARIESVKSRIHAQQRVWTASWEKYLEMRKVTFPITGLALLVLGWAIGQLAVYSTVGPEALIQRYEAAVEESDWSALSDPTLFPQSGIGQDLTLAEAARASVNELAVVNVAREGLNATIGLTLNGTAYEILARAEMELDGLFFTPVWQVTSDTPAMSLDFDPIFDSTQVVLAGSEESNVGDVGAAWSQKLHVLPGRYDFTVKGAGFLADSATTAIATTSDLAVFVENGGLNASAVNKAVTKKIKKATKSCFKKKCKALGKWSDTDFDFWSRYPYTTYTSSKFSWKGKYASCNAPSYQLVSATKIVASSSCSGSVKAHLYIKYVYYSSWYYSRWWYWDYYDSASVSVSSTVTVTTNLDGSKVKIGKVKVTG